MPKPFPQAIATVIALTAAAPLSAQNITGNDLSLSGDITQSGAGPNYFGAAYSTFNGSMCIGNGCTTSDSNGLGNPPLKLKSITSEIIFEDTSTSSFANRDWRISATGNASEETFQIQDWGEDWTTGTATAPFTIEGGAPANAFWLESSGDLGLGTSLPGANLHVVGPGSATFRMETSSGTPRAWQTTVTDQYFWIADVNADTNPFVIEAMAPSDTLWLTNLGNVGIGTDSPDAPLEISDNSTFSFFRITAEGAAVNQSVDITFTQGPLGTGQLRYNIVDGDNQEMSLDADGNMILDGTLTTGGPTCDSGCDAVFDAGFSRLSVSEHAALMWEKGHLPAVGPTLPGQPMNVSEKMGAMLNELEHAHIYIEQLHAEARARDAVIADLVARLEAVEAR